jgi:hypothetical protein
MKRCLIVFALGLIVFWLAMSNRSIIAQRNDTQPTQKTVQSLRVHVLSTMLAGNSNGGIGE